MKRVLLCCLACLLLTGLLACGDDYLVSDDPAKTFTEDVGFSITLTEAFSKYEKEGCTLCYDSSQVAVFCIQSKLSDYPEMAKISFADYVADVVQKNADKKFTRQFDIEGITCVEYETDDLVLEDQTWYFLTAIMNSGDAYWLVQFMCDSSLRDALSPAFSTWLCSVFFPTSA